MYINKIILLLLLDALISGCAAYGAKNFSPSASDLVMCKEPRPEICTLEYDPVCASLKEGASKTAATGCTACSDNAVVGYTMGACEGPTVE